MFQNKKPQKQRKKKQQDMQHIDHLTNGERSKNEVYDSQAIPALGRQRQANLCV